MARYKQVVLILLSFLTIVFSGRKGLAAEFLDPEQAFKVKAELGKDGNITLNWQIAEGYKLYRDRIKVGIEHGYARLGAISLPKGDIFTDPTTGEKLEIYHHKLVAKVPLQKAGGAFGLTVSYQGCAEDGLCYPPIEKVFSLSPEKSGDVALAPSKSGNEDLSGSTPKAENSADKPEEQKATVSKSSGDDMSLAKSTLEGGSLWKVSLAFIAFGLLLSFTPCVLPMVPILSSIIVGEGEATRAKSFLMALAYCLGMALVYTSLGVAAGLAGEGLAGALQKPWVLVLFALLLFGLSLSMFDVYQLQVPASLQNRLNKTSGNLKGGRFFGVFLMGSISALIVGPCVAAPLAGTLVYISQTKNVLIGGLALFSMATGMSVPLLLIGLSAGSLLPKAGAWMIGVKYVFGLMLIGVAIWMVTPVLPAPAVLLAWGALAILCAVFAGVFSAMPDKVTIGAKFTRTLGILLLLVGASELVGAASGASDPLKPLAAFRAQSQAAPSTGGESKAEFKRIKTSEDLDRELMASTKPVMLDFYADWCVACKEMEHLTFSDPKVRQQFANMTLLQVDVTANSENDRALMKRFGLFGPPGIIIFDTHQQELTDRRVVGFLKADEFQKRIENIQ